MPVGPALIPRSYDSVESLRTSTTTVGSIRGVAIAGLASSLPQMTVASG